MSAILVTGAGLLGSAVATALAPNHRVVLADRVVPTNLAGLQKQGVQFERCCILDRERITSLLHAERPDGIVHTAALLGPDSSRDPAAAMLVNVAGTVGLAQLGLNCGVARFVYASSLAVYDFTDAEAALDEMSPKTVRDEYGLAKLFVEGWLERAAERGLNPIILRFAGLYGPGEGGGGWSVRRLREAADKIAFGEALELDSESFGDNEYLHARDAARAVAAAVSADAPLLCNVGAGTVTPFERLAAAFGAHAPTMTTRRGPVKEDYLRRRTPLSIRRAQRLLGYQPSITIEDGIAELIADAQERHLRAVDAS